MTLHHFLFLIFICIVWGLAFIAGKASVEELPPIFFTALRYVLLSVVLLPFLKPVRGHMKEIFMISLLTGSIHFSLFYGGMSIANNVSAVAVATQLSVPFSTILSIVFLREIVRWRRWLGIFLAFMGVMIISFDPAIIDDRLGLLLVVLAVFIGACGTIIMKRISDTGVFEMQAWIAVLSWPVLFVISFIFETGQFDALAQASSAAIGGIIYTALGSSLIGHAGMYYLLQRYDVSLISPLTLLAPIFGISFGIIIWGDQTDTLFWVGSSLTLLGVLVIALRKRDHPQAGANL